MRFVQRTLDLGTGETFVDAAHEDDMVVSAVRHQFVASLHELIGHGFGVLLHLNGVVFELGGPGLLQLGREGSDLVVVRATLTLWEDAKIDRISDLWLREDETGSWSSQRFVRC